MQRIVKPNYFLSLVMFPAAAGAGTETSKTPMGSALVEQQSIELPGTSRTVEMLLDLRSDAASAAPSAKTQSGTHDAASGKQTAPQMSDGLGAFGTQAPTATATSNARLSESAIVANDGLTPQANSASVGSTMAKVPQNGSSDRVVSGNDLEISQDSWLRSGVTMLRENRYAVGSVVFICALGLVVFSRGGRVSKTRHRKKSVGGSSGGRR